MLLCDGCACDGCDCGEGGECGLTASRMRAVRGGCCALRAFALDRHEAGRCGALSSARFAHGPLCRCRLHTHHQTLAFCLDRGALVLEEWALVPFVFLLYVPVYPRHRAGGKKGRLSDSAGGARAMSAGFTGHMAMFVTCIALLSQKAFPLPAVGRYYACGESCVFGGGV